MADEPQSEPSELPTIVPMSLADQTRQRRQQRSASAPLAHGAFVVAAIAFFALFLPYGFDHPSSAGLDFGHFLLALGVFGIALIVGMAAKWSARP